MTRSEPLARKLKLDLYRLIKAQLIARGELKELAKTPSEETLEASSEITLGEKSLFSLQSEDFPLVCTFGEFISLVENTIRFALIQSPEIFLLSEAGEFGNSPRL